LKKYLNWKCQLDFELLGIDEDDLFSYNEDELNEKYELIQDLITRANKTAAVRSGQLGRVRLAENSLSAGVTVRMLANDYLRTINEYVSAAKDASEKMDIRIQDKKTALEEVDYIALNLREWSGMPTAMARAENPSFYFADIRTMAEQYIKADEIKDDLLKRWEEVFLQEDGQARLDELKEINQLGMFSKMSRMNHFIKALSLNFPYTSISTLNNANLYLQISATCSSLSLFRILAISVNTPSLYSSVSGCKQCLQILFSLFSIV
jgi:hypothetical protein